MVQGEGLWGWGNGGAITLGVDVDLCLTRMPGQWLRPNDLGSNNRRERRYGAYHFLLTQSKKVEASSTVLDQKMYSMLISSLPTNKQSPWSIQCWLCLAAKLPLRHKSLSASISAYQRINVTVMSGIFPLHQRSTMDVEDI